MSSTQSQSSSAPRRPWTEPALTRHESMTALTQQAAPTPAPEEIDPVLDSAYRALAVPGSQGFFP